MSMTDPIADLFTRVLNAGRRGHASVKIPASKIKTNILSVLRNEGFIGNYQENQVDGHPVLEADLRYLKGRERTSVITGIKRVSKPGHRVYVGKAEIPRVMGGFGVAILSTSKGVVTDQEARRQGTGGEVLCYIW